MNQHFKDFRTRQALLDHPPQRPTRRPRRGFVVLNPQAGNGDTAAIKKTVQDALGAESYELYETTGDESLPNLVRETVQEGHFAWVAAIGGDGTVSQVANGLVGMETPLAIIPAGTSNVLATELGIPRDAAEACRLLSEGARLRYIDAMCVDEHYYFHQVGAGVEALAARRAPDEAKNRFGGLAYVATAVKQAFGWQPHRFWVTIDCKQRRFDASELLIANTSQIGVAGLRWSAAIRPDDGQLNLIVARARSVFDYAALLWDVLRRRQPRSEHVRIYRVRREVSVRSARPLPLHGDGEDLNVGQHFSATVIPGALGVLVPRPRKAS